MARSKHHCTSHLKELQSFATSRYKQMGIRLTAFKEGLKL